MGNGKQSATLMDATMTIPILIRYPVSPMILAVFVYLHINEFFATTHIVAGVGVKVSPKKGIVRLHVSLY